MRIAVQDGLINHNANASDVTAKCSTGDCTWRDYLSLGVCSSVDDVTPSIIEHCKSASDKGDPVDCSYSVSALEQDPPFSGTNLSEEATLFIGANPPASNFSYPAANTLVEFYVIYLANLSILKDSEPSYVNQLVALRGTINLCLYTYRTSVINGTTVTVQVDKLTGLDWQTAKQDSDHPVVSTTVPGSLDLFSFDRNMVDDFHAYLSLVAFTGTASENERTNVSTYTSDTAQAFAATLYGASPGIQGLSAQLNNLAISMTNAYAPPNPDHILPRANTALSLRTTSITPDSWRGTMYTPEPYFDIQWAWLVVPILSVVLTFVFLLATIYQSRRHHIPAWKSSQIAAMQSLSPEARKAVGDLGSAASAKDVIVRLEHEDGKWQLVESRSRAAGVV